MCFHSKTITNYKVIDGQPVLFNVCEQCTGYDVLWKSFLKSIFSLLTIDKLLPKEEYSLALDSIKNKDQLNSFLYDLAQQRQKVQEILPCPQCGVELKEIVNQTKMGCSKCYDHFKEIIQQVISKVQNGAIKHVGKVPKCKDEVKDETVPEIPAEPSAEPPQETELDKLNREMDLAILQERYEDAAGLRDKIKELKEKT
jgi:protein-arginine kinase activator protein McsA